MLSVAMYSADSSRNVLQVSAKGKGAARRMAPQMAQPQMVSPQPDELYVSQGDSYLHLLVLALGQLGMQEQDTM